MTDATAPPNKTPAKKRAKPRPDALLKKAAAQDPLDALVAKAEAGDLTDAIALMLWQNRFDNPGFTVEIHPKDLKGFQDCVEYLEVRPTVRVYRPGGVPAQEAIPAVGNRRAVPARAAIPPRPYVVVQMTDAKGDAFVPIENNQQDFDRQKAANAERAARDQALSLAQALSNDVQSGQFSTGNIQDAIICLRTLAARR